MKRLIIYISLALFPTMPVLALAEENLVVVANTGGQELTLTREQVRNLFMGASLGYDFRPLALPPRNRTRSLFNTQVIGLTEARIQSYWSQMKFTGRMNPPREFNNKDELLSFIESHEGTVTYLPAGVVIPSGLTIVYSTD